jgi:hypothetical protein
MPEIGEADGRPLLRSASSRAAAARADSACTWMKVRAPSPAGFWMAASASSTSWLLLSVPAARRRDISAIDSWPIALPAVSGDGGCLRQWQGAAGSPMPLRRPRRPCAAGRCGVLVVVLLLSWRSLLRVDGLAAVYTAVAA